MLYYKLMVKPALVALLALAVRACPSSETTRETSLFNRSSQQTTDPSSTDPVDPFDPTPAPNDPPPTQNDPPPSTTELPPGSGSTTPDPSTKVPFDGGLSILLASGAAYGTKKAVEYRKSLKSKSNKG